MRRPKDRKTVRTKLVSDLKRDGDGNLERYKARLVAKSSSQI